MLNYINYIASKVSAVLKTADLLWNSLLGITGLMIIIGVLITGFYTLVEYLIKSLGILYVSIPALFVALLGILLYVYQWKRYQVMMWMQHKVRTKYPLIHKILFLSMLDPIIYKLNAPGLFILTFLFSGYYFGLVIIIYFLSNSREISINLRYEDSYSISIAIAVLLLSYWMNKILLAFAFWLCAFIFLFIFIIVFSLVYCLYSRKKIEQQQEEERQQNIQERYQYNNSEEAQSEESKESNLNISSSSQSRAVLNHLINSMKKSFIIQHKYSKQSATSGSIGFIDFIEKESVIELKGDPKHTFHDAGLSAWTQEHDTCPLCRQRIEN